jgi:hypothetical protein
MNTILAIILLFVSLMELRKGLLILFKKQVHMVFAAKLAFYIMQKLSVSMEKQKEILEDYKSNLKLYGAFTVIGALLFLALSILEIF